MTSLSLSPPRPFPPEMFTIKLEAKSRFSAFPYVSLRFVLANSKNQSIQRKNWAL